MKIKIIFLVSKNFQEIFKFQLKFTFKLIIIIFKYQFLLYFYVQAKY